MKESGNVFAAFTPLAWPTGSPGAIADPSCRTCIVSLVNKHDRPCRLQLKSGQEKYAVSRFESHGPCFGRGHDVAIWVDEDGSFGGPDIFELDTVAESEAGLPLLPFAYGKTLLSGVDDGKELAYSCFCIAELECYTLDA